MCRPPSAKPKATEPSEISKPSSTSSPETFWPVHPLEIATSLNGSVALSSRRRNRCTNIQPGSPVGGRPFSGDRSPAHPALPFPPRRDQFSHCQLILLCYLFG